MGEMISETSTTFFHLESQDMNSNCFVRVKKAENQVSAGAKL